jgi:hypothetical protein
MARVRVENPRLVMKVIRSRIGASCAVHYLPTLIFLDMFELKSCCCDPKDGELWLGRLKSGESPMEDRSRSDVQIDDRT